MLFLQGISKHSEKLNSCNQSKVSLESSKCFADSLFSNDVHQVGGQETSVEYSSILLKELESVI